MQTRSTVRRYFLCWILVFVTYFIRHKYRLSKVNISKSFSILNCWLNYNLNALMRTLLLGLIFIGLTQAAMSQSTVRGRIVDTLEKKNLENAVVSLLKRSDSSLV